MGRITIKDIAKLLKISPSTVSRALKDHPDISLETIEQVKRVAEDLGYAPNYQAINFRKQESRIIGVILPDMNMFFFPSIIQAIEAEISNRGYHLIVLHSNDLLEREKQNVNICRNFGIDGLLVSLSSETRNVDHFKTIAQKGIPIVYFDRVLENDAIPQIIIRDELVAEKAVTHLISRGRKKICGVFGNPNLTISKLRFNGFKKALFNHGIDLPDRFIIYASDIEQAHASVRNVLNEGDHPDAIFSMSDELLVGVMSAINEKRLEIPKSLSVISISNGEVPNFFYPPITYVEHSGNQVGKMAATLLFDLIEKPGTLTPESVELDTHLVIQGST